jgi:spoIIIJ-associated protein
MTSLEMTGKSISEAVELGAKELGVSLADIEYEVIQEPSKGFLGIGAKPAKVLVKLAGVTAEEEKKEKIERKNSQPKPEKKFEAKKSEPKKQPKAETKEVKKEEPKKSEPKPVAEVKPEVKEPVQPAQPEVEETQSERMNLTDEDKKKIVSSATDFLKEVFEAMNMKVNLDAKFEDNKQIIVEMTGDDMGVIIGKRGQTLDSLQYLTNLVVNKGEYPYMNVTLDTEGYRMRRKETLEHLAFNLAKKAKHIRKNVVLEPMNPYERRIIHSTLQNDRFVTTYSEGTEPYRYVVISPKANYRSGYRKERTYREDRGFKAETSIANESED